LRWAQVIDRCELERDHWSLVEIPKKEFLNRIGFIDPAAHEAGLYRNGKGGEFSRLESAREVRPLFVASVPERTPD
jgi:hypothetical protein